jgi:outer membrane protein OmpU
VRTTRRGGQGGASGQRAGNVFVSGDWGTLTFGDTDGADARVVGDLNEVGLTCLTCLNETPFISNGGGFGDDSNNFAVNPEARPTVPLRHRHRRLRPVALDQP